MTERNPLNIDPDDVNRDPDVPDDDLDGVEQVVGIFDEQLGEADRIALGIDRLVPTDDVVLPEPDPAE